MLTTLAWMLLPIALPASELPPTPDFWLQRSAVHYGDLDEQVLRGLLSVDAQMVQVGFFGAGYLAAHGAAQKRSQAEFWGAYGGGEIKRQMMKRFIERAHAKGVRVQGMFSIALTYGNLQDSDGLVHAIDHAWPEDRLGPRPQVSALEMLQRDVHGKPLDAGSCEEKNTVVWGCPANPHWRRVLKALVKDGIELGLDGFTITFAQRQTCACLHCQRGLREFLVAKYEPDVLRERFGIENIATHTFPAINGFYKPHEASPLALECLKFGQRMLFECEKEVLLDYGRRLKPDLIVGQWNHIYCYDCNPWNDTFAQLSGDERCTLPTELWGVGENFTWFSIGNAGGYWRPEEGEYAQFTLEHKYLHEAGRGLPQTIKVDDEARLRTYLAEAVAHGGFGPARGPHYKDPDTCEVLNRYFGFLREHEHLYRPIESYAEVGLVFPRRAVHRGETEPVAAFKRAGKWLSRRNVLYDVVLDEFVDAERLQRYQVVLLPREAQIGRVEEQTMRDWQSGGGDLRLIPEHESMLFSKRGFGGYELSKLDSPPTLTWSIWKQQQYGRLVVHLVNYDRDVEVAKRQIGPAREAMRVVNDVDVRLRVPDEALVKHVSVLSPDTSSESVQRISFSQKGKWLELSVPRIEVYSILVIQYI